LVGRSSSKYAYRPPADIHLSHFRPPLPLLSDCVRAPPRGPSCKAPATYWRLSRLLAGPFVRSAFSAAASAVTDSRPPLGLRPTYIRPTYPRGLLSLNSVALLLKTRKRGPNRSRGFSHSPPPATTSQPAYLVIVEIDPAGTWSIKKKKEERRRARTQSAQKRRVGQRRLISFAPAPAPLGHILDSCLTTA
jgi:hypothetical protein